MSDNMRGDYAENIIGDIPDPAYHGLLYARTVCGIAGASGIGKSFAVRRIVADWSRTRGNVIYGNLEDDRIMQRFSLEAAGADMSKVRLASYQIGRDNDELEYDIRTQKVSLVVFDTCAKHINGAPISRWDGPLAELHDLCQRLDVTAILVHHTNKNVKKNDDWRAAIGGQTAGFTGTCRIINLVGKRPDMDDQIVVCQVKNSYAGNVDALAYEWGTEDLTQANGAMIEVSFLTMVEKDLKITNPTALVCLKGDNEGKKGPTPEKAAEAAEFLQVHLAAGAHPVNDVYLCNANPLGAVIDAATGKLVTADHGHEDMWKGRKCGHMSIKQVETATPQGGSHQCPGCGSSVKQIAGLRTLADEAMIAHGTIKRAKAALEVDTDCKGFATERVQYWSLPDDHPSLDESSPRVERVPLYDAVGNPELDPATGQQLETVRAMPLP